MVDLTGPSREQGHEVRWKVCPHCGRDYWSVSQNMDTGAYYCYGCGYGGSVDTGMDSNRLLDMLKPRLPKIEWPEVALPEWQPLGRTARKYLRERGVENPVDFGIVEMVNSTRILIPYFGPDGAVIYYVTRWFVDDGRPKYEGAIGRKPPYVLPEWRSYDEPVTFVEGPFDAIVYHLATGLPVVALGGTSLPDFLVPVVDQLARGERRLMLDHDALAKGLGLSQQLGADIIRLPAGYDPARYYAEEMR